MYKYIIIFFLFIAPAISQSKILEISVDNENTLLFESPIKNISISKDDSFFTTIVNYNSLIFIALEEFNKAYLLVTCNDGLTYSFELVENNESSAINMQLEAQEATNYDLVEKASENLKMLSMIAEDVFITPSYLRVRSKTTQNKISLNLQGVWAYKGFMFFKISLKNKSNLDYDIRSLNFTVNVNKKISRYSDQESNYFPIYIHGNTDIIEANSQRDIVYAFKRFNINNKKSLRIELWEEYGDRNPSLVVPDYYILNAKSL